MINFGKVKPGSTLYVPFTTYKAADADPVTITGLAVGDIQIFKNSSMTQRATTTGFTLLDTDGIDIDTRTGLHGFSIDLSSDATADFYEAGASYFVVVDAITVDSITARFIAARFDIGYEGAILDTTIATLATQTGFTLDAGPAEDDALNGCVALIHDKASAVQIALGFVSDYTGSTKTIALKADPGIFTMAAGDNISFFHPANAHAINSAKLVGDGNATPWDGA